MRLFWSIVASFILASIAGCAAPSGEPAPSGSDSSPDRYAHIEGQGTSKMVRVLDTLNAEARTHPMDYFHLNHLRAEHLRSQIEEAPPEEKIQYRYTYAYELLYAGETEAAIRELAALLEELGASVYNMNRRTKPIFDLLGVAYMQMGEEQNCIANHTARSCILPITGAGVHTKQAGSRKAIALYQQMIRRFRTDLQARWLLNIASMTVGEYPDGVPERWRIDGIEADANSAIHTFHDVAIDLGVDHNGLAGGTSVEDFNNDGFLDIMATSYGLDDQMKLYMNDGKGGFVDRTEEAGLTGLVDGLNMTHADYNNDGYEDAFILRGAWLGKAGERPNSLLRNNGDGTFTDVTYEAGLASYHPTQTAAWGDFNNDGWIDLFIGNESKAEINLLTGKRNEEAGVEHPSELYLNNGDGTFTEVARQVGVDVNAYVKGTAWGDVNNDGLQDLYVSVLGGRNRLYVNQGGTSVDDWSFEERAAQAGVQAPIFSFPTWFWDYNNDGDQDLFVASYDVRYFTKVARAVAAEFMDLSMASEVEKPRVYKNNGDGTFTEVSKELNLDKILFAMGSNYGDLDNDGYPDFYIGTGEPDLRSLVPNRMFHNIEGKRFEEVSFEGGFAHIQKGHAVGFGDFDRDGDQDIYSVIGGSVEGDNFQNVLFENPGHDNNWITLEVEGRTANRSAIGARLQLTVVDPKGQQRTIYTTVSTGGSFGASSLQQEIGLGDATRIETLTVTWPNADRTTQTFEDLAVNQTLKIVEGQEPVPLDRKPVPFKTMPDEMHESTATR